MPSETDVSSDVHLASDAISTSYSCIVGMVMVFGPRGATLLLHVIVRISEQWGEQWKSPKSVHNRFFDEEEREKKGEKKLNKEKKWRGKKMRFDQIFGDFIHIRVFVESQSHTLKILCKHE